MSEEPFAFGDELLVLPSPFRTWRTMVVTDVNKVDGGGYRYIGIAPRWEDGVVVPPALHVRVYSDDVDRKLCRIELPVYSEQAILDYLEQAGEWNDC